MKLEIKYKHSLIRYRINLEDTTNCVSWRSQIHAANLHQTSKNVKKKKKKS